MPHPRPHAFTLIELLVVITIIVVLLAVLTPALDKAIYQAELVQCGANQRAIAGGIIQYAFDHNRRYPHRGLPEPTTGGASQGQNSNFIQPHQLANPYDGQGGPGSYDVRPGLRGYVLINKMLNDPFCEPVDLEGEDLPTANDSFLFSSLYLWHGWRYFNSAPGTGFNNMVGGRGMFKLGDRWSWTEGARTYSLNLLVCDYDVPEGGTAYSSHPDGAILSPVRVDHQPFPFGGFITASDWRSAGNLERAPLDMNFGHDDGSVRRFDRVVYREKGLNRDERMLRVRNGNRQQGNVGFSQVPRQ